jgi:hypothetical protein
MDRDQAALALDLTHALDGRGPRTFLARQRVALWLDTGRGRVAEDVRWLLHLVGVKN